MECSPICTGIPCKECTVLLIEGCEFGTLLYWDILYKKDLAVFDHSASAFLFSCQIPQIADWA